MVATASAGRAIRLNSVLSGGNNNDDDDDEDTGNDDDGNSKNGFRRARKTRKLCYSA